VEGEVEEARFRTVTVKLWDSRAERTEGPRLPSAPRRATFWIAMFDGVGRVEETSLASGCFPGSKCCTKIA